jgi:glycosyltransferase involved in cell wall biosynthesis
LAELLTKKVVLISGFRIFPNSTGGHIRTGSFARALARSGHRVLIYSLAGRKEDYRNPDAGRDGRRVDQVEQNLTEETNLGLGFGLLQGAGRRLGLPRVWQYALVRAGVVPARLRAALADADVVISDMPWVAQIAAIAGRKPWFLLSHNLEHRLLEQGTASHRLAAGWMRRIEAAAPRHFRDILACAEEDRDFFRAHDDGGRLQIPIVRNGVDPLAYAAIPGTRQRVRAELGLGDADRLLVFSGSGFGPNLEALEMLKAFCSAERAFLESARIRVLILGSMSPRAYRDGALIATGRVPEVVPYFAAGDAGLNPVMRGSGANVKIFEYLAARLPVISTTFGVRGTELTAGRDFLVYEGGAGLKTALESFVASRSPEQWRAHAEDVWQRHRRSCNMEDIVREALARLPEFGAATV